MKTLPLLALLLPCAALAATPESLLTAADSDFARSHLMVRAALLEAAQPQEPVLQPALKPIPDFSMAKSELARLSLATQLDRNLNLMNKVLGKRALDIGFSADSGYKNYFLTFTDKQGTAIGPVGDLGKLRGEGVNIRVDASTVYNFRVQANIFNPVRGSTLYMTPVQGTSGPNYSMKTGVVLDAVRARAALVTIQGEEYWFFYGRDILTDGSDFAKTRSFLIIHEAGLSTKAWPLAEASLKPDVPSNVDLNGVQVTLTRTSTGQLIVGGD